MIQVIKDAVSLFVYLFITPFYTNKNVVLVYHAVEEMDPEKDPYKMNVPPELFRRQMEHISKCPGRYLVTFDDGFESVYINAFPVLKRYRIKSALFLTTDYIDSKISLDDFFYRKHNPRPLTWDQVKDMYSGGMEIGSHTLTHTKMSGLDCDMIQKEVVDSRRRIESMVGCGVVSFSYPFGNRGSFGKETGAILKESGYKKAYANIMGMDNSLSEPFAINRIRIYGSDSIFRFRMKVAGAYNWVDRVCIKS